MLGQDAVSNNISFPLAHFVSTLIAAVLPLSSLALPFTDPTVDVEVCWMGVSEGRSRTVQQFHALLGHTGLRRQHVHERQGRHQ